jgi:hypothetical protein
MKTSRTVALIFSLLLANAHAADVRNVGGRTVNLDMIHQWMITRKGERPMPHWRDFTPVDYMGIINGGYAFRVVVAAASLICAGLRAWRAFSSGHSRECGHADAGFEDGRGLRMRTGRSAAAQLVRPILLGVFAPVGAY